MRNDIRFHPEKGTLADSGRKSDYVRGGHLIERYMTLHPYSAGMGSGMYLRAWEETLLPEGGVSAHIAVPLISGHVEFDIWRTKEPEDYRISFLLQALKRAEIVGKSREDAIYDVLFASVKKAEHIADWMGKHFPRWHKAITDHIKETSK